MSHPTEANHFSIVGPDGTEDVASQCARCGSSVTWIDCEHCADGFTSHECGEDSCCCADPEDNVPCDICGGAGGWWECLSSIEYCEAAPPREGER